jgi:uncharacterized peroxidase-related enzyme
MYLRTIAESEATGRVAEIYNKQKASMGFVMETAKCMTTRPDLLPIYTEFSDQIRAGFSLGMREWRLITLIAAKHIPSTYCSYVYSGMLLSDLGSKAAVLAVQQDFRRAGLPVRDVEMLVYAEQITIDASKVTQTDIDRLRGVGFSDQQISDIALCASFRAFVSRFFDAVGTTPEPAYVDEDPEFKAAMTVGRRF